MLPAGTLSRGRRARRLRSMNSSSLRQHVETLAREAGFSTAGIAAVPAPGSIEEEEDCRRFNDWIEQGCSGEMGYLQRRDEAGHLLRSSLRVALPWARTVIVCAANYNSDQPRSIDPTSEGRGWIARYAWSGNGQRPTDYHKVLLRRLEALRDRLTAELGPFESRCFVDTGPVVERVYARHAGIGWIGKNTCFMNQKLGSWLFLGVIVTSLQLPEALATILPAADRCGSCTRCLEACPTGALTGPRSMDASRCISYLTIEKRGSIPEDLRTGVGRQIFGCDICQDVCPWNRKAPVAADPDLAPRGELVNPALDWLAAMDEEAFGRRFNGSPVRRAQWGGFRRNLAIAMGNSGQAGFLSTLRQWAQAPDPFLAEAAQWAVRRLNEPSANTTQAHPENSSREG